MIERIDGLPPNVLGLEAHGEVTADDYRAVLVPALEEKLAELRRVRLLYVLGADFDGFSSGAMWEDTKVGLRHMTRFERVAVVTDADWLQNAVQAFGFVLQGEVRVFETENSAEARGWICEPPELGKLSFDLRLDDGILVLWPRGELEASDFDEVAAALAPYLEAHDSLQGLMIVAQGFPGWDDFAAFAAHLGFVRAHRRFVRRLAVVSDDRLLSVLPTLARHGVVDEARHFAADEEAAALAWLGQAD